MSWSAILILAVAVLAMFPQLAPQNFPADDSLFYMQVARNIAAGHGSTFNTITPTNGYHPLWMAVCVAAAWIARGDRLLLLRIAFAIQGLLALFILLRFRKLVAPESPTGWLLGAAVVAPYFLTGMYGSEAHLNGALLMLACGVLLRSADRPGIGAMAWLGGLLGIAVLARLDNIFVATTMIGAAAVASRAKPGQTVGRVLMGTLALAAVLLPYLATNTVAFGGPIPISGAIKSTFPHVTGRIANLGSLGTIVAAGAVAGLAAAAIHRVASRLRRLLLALSSGVLLHALYVVLFTNHLTHWSWYYVPGVLNLGVLIAAVWPLLAGWMAIRAQCRAAGAVAALLLALALARGAARVMNPQAVGNNQLRLELSRGEQRWTISLAQWLDRRLPRGAGMMTYDYPGALAFYSSLRILPEDGLIGDYAYSRDLVREGAAAYLRSRRVEYYMGTFGADGNGSVEVFAPLGHRSAGFLTLRRENLVARVRDLPHMGGAPDVGVWALRP